MQRDLLRFPVVNPVAFALFNAEKKHVLTNFAPDARCQALVLELQERFPLIYVRKLSVSPEGMKNV